MLREIDPTTGADIRDIGETLPISSSAVFDDHIYLFDHEPNTGVHTIDWATEPYSPVYQFAAIGEIEAASSTACTP